MEIVSETAARAVVDIGSAIDLMAQVFASLARGECEIFPIVQGRGGPAGSRLGLKSGSIGSGTTLGVKVGTYWPANSQRGLPNHGSTTLLLDPLSGLPVALVAASYLNGLRTAAANGLATKLLSRSEAGTLGVVGAGHQAWFEVCAVCSVRKISRVLIWSRNQSKAHALAERVRRELKVTSESTPIEAAAGCDVVVTVTAATAPLVRREWIKPGAHISAMGADGPGKQELHVEVLEGARLFADLPSQSVQIGEFERAFQEKKIGLEEIAGLGDVVVGRAAGRGTASEITVFDSSGIALQDLFLIERILARAIAEGSAHSVPRGSC
jgi:ornithine cyclodeaminase